MKTELTEHALNQLIDAAFEDDSIAESLIDGILSTTYDSVMAIVVLGLLRKIQTYEHVLSHVAEDSEWHRPSACVECQAMARGALAS